MTNRKKMALAGLLVLVMVASAVMGTLAYLTDTSSLENTFLVGAFTPPKGGKRLQHKNPRKGEEYNDKP